jgi:hypothetical protein
MQHGAVASLTLQVQLHWLSLAFIIAVFLLRAAQFAITQGSGGNMADFRKIDADRQTLTAHVINSVRHLALSASPASDLYLRLQRKLEIC